jgi:environmental stress-induced protein Ves
VVPWANGLGTTAVVARHPDTDDWAWRLSIADVVADGPFSSLPDVDRWIAVVTGAGMVLTVDGLDTTLTASSDAFAFDGGAVTSCRLLDGPIHDINLMLRRGRATGTLDVVTAESPVPLAGITACVVLDGTASIAGVHLDAHDAVLDPTRPAVPEGHARLALIRVVTEMRSPSASP